MSVRRGARRCAAAWADQCAGARDDGGQDPADGACVLRRDDRCGARTIPGTGVYLYIETPHDIDALASPVFSIGLILTERSMTINLPGVMYDEGRILL
jgi:hypothetical protein